MKKVLIAYDGTTGAEAAIHDLLRAGLPESTNAVVLSIADVWLPPESAEDTSEMHAKAREAFLHAKEVAVKGSQLVHSMFPHWTVTNEAVADSPSWGIMAAARRLEVDLVVVGSHGRTPLERIFLGSVSFKVAAEAQCSVRIARPRDHVKGSSPRLLVGVDGSAGSTTCVEEVTSRNWPVGTRVELVAVIEPHMKRPVGNSGEPINSRETIEESVRSQLGTVAAKCALVGLEPTPHIFEGEAKSTILRHASAWNVDTIFMGARGSDHAEKYRLGTTASAICSRAHCSVEVIR